jgi:excisionase family DNA binding protein
MPAKQTQIPASDPLDQELGAALRSGLGKANASLLMANLQVAIPGIAAILTTMQTARLDHRPRETAEDGITTLGGEGDDLTLADTPFEARAADLIKSGDWEDIYPGLDLLTTDEAANALGISQPTVLQWIEKGKLLGLRKAKRGYRIPADTLLARRAAMPGMAYVINEICGGHHNLAWAFLNSPPADDGLALRILDLLQEGDLDAVKRAATSWAEGFTA